MGTLTQHNLTSGLEPLKAIAFLENLVWIWTPISLGAPELTWAVVVLDGQSSPCLVSWDSWPAVTLFLWIFFTDLFFSLCLPGEDSGLLPAWGSCWLLVANLRVSTTVTAVVTEIPMEGVEPHASAAALFLLAPVGAKWAWMPGWHPGRLRGGKSQLSPHRLLTPRAFRLLPLLSKNDVVFYFVTKFPMKTLSENKNGYWPSRVFC